MIRDLAVMLADGGECVSDLGAVRDQEPLFGAVASDSTAFRVIDRIASEPGLVEALRAAHARSRERFWELHGAPESLTIDVDATLITAHSEKERAAGNYKHGFGFHPLVAYADETREALGALLRPGNAGANTAADNQAVLDLALEQIPAKHIEGLQILVRADSAGATHALAHVEDRIRDDKDTGLSKLPFKEFALNEVWLQIVMLAHDLLVWAQALLLDGELAKAEPKRLRYRLLHVAARLAFHSRKAKLHLQRTWPWATELTPAFQRLNALPAPSGSQQQPAGSHHKQPPATVTVTAARNTPTEAPRPAKPPHARASAAAASPSARVNHREPVPGVTRPRLLHDLG